jgi:hypothetical protein
MFSAESLTSPHPGFPELFQTGETYHGRPLVDHQHPHNVFAELSLYYTQPLTDKISWLFYGGPVADPALGPVAFMHRASAAELPMAPLSHHLQDSTHTSFGVVTTGLIVHRFRLSSLFNGRRLTNSVTDTTRCTRFLVSAPGIAPSARWTAQYSYGRLDIEPRTRQRRRQSAIEYVRPFDQGLGLRLGAETQRARNRNLSSYLRESTVNSRARTNASSNWWIGPNCSRMTHHPSCVGAYAGRSAIAVHNRLLRRLAAGLDVLFRASALTRSM